MRIVSEITMTSPIQPKSSWSCQQAHQAQQRPNSDPRKGGVLAQNNHQGAQEEKFFNWVFPRTVLLILQLIFFSGIGPKGTTEKGGKKGAGCAEKKMSVRSATDETQPLLRSVTDEGQHVFANPPLENGADIPDTTIIDFDPSGDAENPLEWAAPFKWTIVSMLAMMAFTVCVSIPPQPLAVPYY